MSIELRKIDENNFLDTFNLKMTKEQEKFVSSPIRSLAQAYVYREQCQPFGIYNEDSMIGYVLVIYDYDKDEYNIWHMLIDVSYQGKGYGSKALDEILEYIKTKPFGKSNKVILTCNENNDLGLKLYNQKGFIATGNKDGDEIELSLTIK